MNGVTCNQVEQSHADANMLINTCISVLNDSKMRLSESQQRLGELASLITDAEGRCHHNLENPKRSLEAGKALKTRLSHRRTVVESLLASLSDELQRINEEEEQADNLIQQAASQIREIEDRGSSKVDGLKATNSTLLVDIEATERRIEQTSGVVASLTEGIHTVEAAEDALYVVLKQVEAAHDENKRKLEELCQSDASINAVCNDSERLLRKNILNREVTASAGRSSPGKARPQSAKTLKRREMLTLCTEVMQIRSNLTSAQQECLAQEKQVWELQLQSSISGTKGDLQSAKQAFEECKQVLK